jgi:hypothetical protein
MSLSVAKIRQYCSELHLKLLYSSSHNGKLRTVIYSLMSTVLCDEMPCNGVEVYKCLRGTYCFHLQGQGVNKTSKQASSKLMALHSIITTKRLSDLTSVQLV